MNVKELREMLVGLDDDLLVVMAKDSEGNYHSPLSDTDADADLVYVPNNTWSGDTYLAHLTPEDIERGFTNEDLYDGDDAVKCVVLSPIN